MEREGRIREWLRGPLGRVLGPAALVTVGTRLLGLGSQSLVVAGFGAGVGLDAYLVALILPGLLATPLLGAIEVGLAPAYARLGKAPASDRARFRSGAFASLGLVAVPVFVLLPLAAPVLVPLTAPGIGEAERQLAVDVARIVYPVIGLRVVGAVAGALLLGSERYVTPLVLRGVNPLAIIVLMVAVPEPTIVQLAWATLAGDLLELLLLVVSVRVKEGRFGRVEVAAARHAMAGLGGILLMYLVARSVATVDQSVAAGVGTGSLTIFVLATRVFDVTTAVGLMPFARTVSTHLGQEQAEHGTVGREWLHPRLRRAVLIGAVSALAMAVLAPVLVFGVFARGEFTTDDAWRTVYLAEIFVLALVPLAVEFTLFRVILGLRGARPLILVKGLHGLVNLGLNVLLAAWIGLYGIALSTVLTYCGVVVLEWKLLDPEVRGSGGGSRSPAPVGENELGPAQSEER